MAKRMQEQKEEEIIVAKSKSTAMNLSSTVPASSSSAKNPIFASRSPGKLIDSGKPGSRMRRRNSKSDAASSSQVKLQDAYLGGLMEKAAGKPVATDEKSRTVDLPESETWSYHEDEETGEPVTYKTVAGKPVASSNSESSGNPKAERKEWPQNLRVSSRRASHGYSLLEASFSQMLRTGF